MSQEAKDQLSDEPKREPDAKAIIVSFLLEHVAEFRQLSELRDQGWRNPEGDRHFEKQRRQADNANERSSRFFHEMMIKIGRDIHQSTGAFNLFGTQPEPPNVLDMCMAPGGFLASVLDVNPEANALAFSLPVAEGGHKVLLPSNSKVEMKLLDITMLAADMAVSDIPAEHPDAKSFLTEQITNRVAFDLVICDGQVLRTQKRASYREAREARRLTVTQLALGLEHVKLGGTMVVLLHKVEAPDTMSLLYTFSKFSSLRLYKHSKFHATRSSFYMIATNIQRQHREVDVATGSWKKVWRVATLGTDEEYERICEKEPLEVQDMLENFGTELVRLARNIWKIQARALERASFIRKN